MPFLLKENSLVSNIGPTLLALQETLCPQSASEDSKQQHRQREGKVKNGEWRARGPCVLCGAVC
jgi:hypothetical protein